MKLSGMSLAFGRLCAMGIVVLCLPGAALGSDQWVKPTAEELSMTSVPGFPGVAALYLFREETTKDDLHVVQHYERIKILTEEGKRRANVELSFVSSQSDGFSYGDDLTVGDVSGRTIHADGTVIPFTGKPYLKTMEKGKGFKYQARVFTLPDVEVGSIIEYRYATRYNDNIYEAPNWYIQGPLFTRAAHFVWYPTTHQMTNEDDQQVNSISWFPILPPDAKLERKELPGGGNQVYEVTVKDVPPEPKEEYMPPMASMTYRVLFNFTPYRTVAEYWKSEGKRWSKRANNFIGPDNALKVATQPIIAGASTESEKLHKIYVAVMALENTDYTRSRGQNEDKAAGLGKVQSAVDVLKRGRGNSVQLTDLFVGMARAAGLKAYAMLVPNREQNIFTPLWLNVNQQLSNTIAIVSADGKEQFFGPGERYASYGHLEWRYTYVQGLRQTDGGTEFAMTPGDTYKDTHTGRYANLTMAEDGSVKGNIGLTYNGAHALQWRHEALTGDDESLRHDLRASLEEMLPKTLEVKVLSIDNLTDCDKSLDVKFEVKGTIGTPTGKRLVVPVDIFLAASKIPFAQEKRELPVYFHFPESIRDTVRINLPPTMTVEAVPADSKLGMNGAAAYTLAAKAAPGNVVVTRDFAFNALIVPTKDYSSLRTFYSQFQAKDQESIVLKVGAPGSPAGN